MANNNLVDQNEGPLSSEEIEKSFIQDFRKILNKSQTIDHILNKLLEIDTQSKVQGVLQLIFEKAISDPSTSVACAFICKELTIIGLRGWSDQPTRLLLRKLIICRCQNDFEVHATTDPSKIPNNLRFIGELFKQGLLTKKIMHFCIKYVLKNRNEGNIESLCDVLTSVGKLLESDDDLAEHLQQLRNIMKNKDSDEISPRVCGMIRNVIALGANNWEPFEEEEPEK